MFVYNKFHSYSLLGVPVACIYEQCIINTYIKEKRMNEELKPQTPAEGILKWHDHGHSQFFHVDCQCGTPEHSMVFEVEVDREFEQVAMTTFVEVFVPTWKEKFHFYDDDYNSWWKYDFKYWVNNIFNRLTLIKRAIFNDTVGMDVSIIMSEQQAINYANTILQSVKEVQQYKK